ncbi:MAG: hypothetical protein ACNYPE_00970 [Candidatus Azotimanducaceae bacterium WSBS_2022_MAG_OTU7]
MICSGSAAITNKYFQQVFPAGLRNTQNQFRAMEKLLQEHPLVGHETHRDDVREFSLANIPFSVIYRPQPYRIEVLRMWDERGDGGWR